MIKKDHIISCRVYVEDTDLMGIVYHARYLNFFERARTETLRDYNFSLTSMAEYNTYFAIRQINIIYHKPACLDDLLSIQTSFSERSASSLAFEQKMFNQHHQLIAEASVVVVTVDKAMKPKRVSAVLKLLGE